jgi:hypothetical protein
MIRIFTIVATIWTGAFCVALADETQSKIPSLNLLSTLVGLQATSEEFHEVLTAYDFSENPKRDDSWGSSFGIFLELRDKVIQIGMRPPSDATNMQTYPGKLPKGLIAGDSIEEIKRKLGEPQKTAHDPKNYYEMSYDGITIYTMSGKLYEVWLVPMTNNKVEQAGIDQPSTAPQLKAEANNKPKPEAEVRPR